METIGDVRKLIPSTTREEFQSSLSTPEKEAALLDGVRDFKLMETEFEYAAKRNPMLSSPKAKSPQQEVFAEVFAAKGLHVACRKLQTMKQRVISAAGKWCPECVKKIGRKILHL